MDQSLFEIIKTGGVAMWLIITCSVIVVALALERAVSLWGYVAKARALTETVTRCLGRGAVAEARAACERSKSPLGDVFLVGFERSGRGSREELDGGVERERLRVTLDLKSRLWVLGTVGAVAPFVGLYGTVVGIMQAFSDIFAKGQGGFAVVAKGLSEALVATAAGILVAVLSVVIYNFFMQHLARISMELRLLVEEFMEVLRGRPAEAAPGAAEGREAKA